MQRHFRYATVAVVTLAAALLLLTGVRPAAGQASATGQAPAASRTTTPGQFPPYRAPRPAAGTPDVNEIGQAFVTADIDFQDHDAQAGPHPDIRGAYGAWPGGQG